MDEGKHKKLEISKVREMAQYWFQTQMCLPILYLFDILGTECNDVACVAICLDETEAIDYHQRYSKGFYLVMLSGW